MNTILPDHPPDRPTPPEFPLRQGWWQRLRHIAAPVTDRVRLLSLLEQALISIANFAGLLVLARNFGASEFGLYSFAYLSLMLILNVQRSLVVVPFVIHAAEPEYLAREGKLWRRLNALVTLGCSALLALGAAVVPVFGGPQWMSMAWLAAALFVPGSFAYEFFRRWAIQRHEYGRTVLAAGCYLVVFCAGILVATKLHSLAGAVAAFVVACGGAAVVCRPRPMAWLPGPTFREFLREIAGFLSWSLLSNLAYNGYYYLPPLILGALAGPLHVAVYQAMRNFTQPLNMLGTAVDNFDKPRAARAMARDGIDGMWRQLLRTTVAMSALGAPYILLLIIFGDPLVGLVYADKYGDQVQVLHLWIVWNILSNAVYPLETALFVTRRPDLLFRGRLVAAVIGVGVTLAAAAPFGVVGTMFGLMGGTAVSGLMAYRYLGVVRRAAERVTVS